MVHIIFGLFGAVFVLISGFDTAGRTALTKGLRCCKLQVLSTLSGYCRMPVGCMKLGACTDCSCTQWHLHLSVVLWAGTSMMLVFMATITWTWWINRQGVLYWNLDSVPFWNANCSAEKRNRTVHILKNISIVGALTMLQQMAKYESQDQFNVC